MTKMTAREKYEQDVKQERVAEYLGCSNSEFPGLDLDANHFCLYGKFDPIHLDDFGDRLVKRIESGAILSSYRTHKYYTKIQSCSEQQLKTLLGRFPPSFNKRISSHRFVFYCINLRLSELGIAPRWRGMTRPTLKNNTDWTEGELRYMRDMQVFDMEWIHRYYPKHNATRSYKGIIKKFMKQKPFNYADACMMAASNFKASSKAKLFRLTKDMQAEMNVFRDKSIDKKHRTLIRALDEVETDLVLAANRNRRRGSKLLSAIAEKSNLWLSVMMTECNSETVMIENYAKLTGVTLNRSTFRSKLKSLNSALKEVGSRHAF